MKQIKKHLKRLHKIRVHHNRWFIWAIVIVCITFFSLFYYIKVSNLLLDSSQADPSILYRQGVLYKDSFLGFSLRHPANWGVESQERNIIEFNNPYNYGDGFIAAVYDLKDEAAFRKSLSIAGEEQVTVANEPSIWLDLNPTVVDNADSAVLVPHNGKLYVIKGHTVWFRRIVETLNFIPIKN